MQKVPDSKQWEKQKKRGLPKDPFKGAKHYENRTPSGTPRIDLKSGKTLERNPWPKMDLKGLFKKKEK